MAVVLTTNAGSIIAHVGGIFDRSIPKGQFSIVNNGGKYISIYYSSQHSALRLDVDTTLDGNSFSSLDDLADALSAFSRGGTGPSSGVQSLSGDLVDNADPQNPKVNMLKLDEGKFLVGGVSGNVETLPTPNILGMNPGGGTTGTVRFATFNRTTDEFREPYPGSTGAFSGTVLIRTGGGQGKVNDAVDIDDAVNLGQTQQFLSDKVDKVSGKGLSDTNFTADEKSKLAGFEDVHYKGWFPSLTALETKYPTADEGAHAFVDDVSGSVLYIWDVDTTSWAARIGESTELTASQAKVLYESNPDTNAFTDDEKAKLASITSIFTALLKTAYDNAVSWINANKDALLNHLSSKSNPHDVTASQVGLGNVDNTKDVDKPISTAAQTALDNKADFPSTNGHIPARDSSGAQTSIPYTTDHLTGETCVVLRGPAGRINSVDPISDQHVATKKYADRVWTPDYSNMETVNRITVTGGTWTVPAGYRGFVKLFTKTYEGSNVLDFAVFLINGKEIERIWQEAPNGTTPARSGSRSGIFPVKPGDTIQVYGNLERSCYFIPGIWV